MWTYNKMLEFPVKIKTTNPKLAMAIMSQLGGPDGEKGASTRYLSQRYSMKDKRVIGVLTDIGTEEHAHQCWKWSDTKKYIRFLAAHPIQKVGHTRFPLLLILQYHNHIHDNSFL